MQFTSGYTSSLAARAGAFGRVRVSHRCFKNVQLTSRRASWLAGATPAGEAPARIEGPATADSAAAEGSDEDLDEKEKLRRSRISQANSGRTPWNKGRKHSPGAGGEGGQRRSLPWRFPLPCVSRRARGRPISAHDSSTRGQGSVLWRDWLGCQGWDQGVTPGVTLMDTRSTKTLVELLIFVSA